MKNDIQHEVYINSRVREVFGPIGANANKILIRITTSREQVDPTFYTA